MFYLFLAEQLNRFAGFGIGLVRWDSLRKNVIQQQLGSTENECLKPSLVYLQSLHRECPGPPLHRLP